MLAFVIRIRGHAVSEDEAAELANRLRLRADEAGLRVAEGLDRGLLMGTALVGTDRLEAQELLSVIEEWAPERLRIVRDDLRRYLGIEPVLKKSS
jgi:hypothetical protein